MLPGSLPGESSGGARYEADDPSRGPHVYAGRPGKRDTGSAHALNHAGAYAPLRSHESRTGLLMLAIAAGGPTRRGVGGRGIRPAPSDSAIDRLANTESPLRVELHSPT